MSTTARTPWTESPARSGFPASPGASRPLVNSSITSRTGGGDPRSLANSLLFELPDAALGEGSRQLIVTITPPADRGGGWSVSRHVPVEFGATTGLRAIGLRYSYSNVPQALIDEHQGTQPGLDVRPGWWQARPNSTWESMRLMAENVLPLARLTIDDDAPDKPWGSKTFDCRPGQRPSGLRYCDGYLDAIEWAGRYADTVCPGGGCLVLLLQPESELTGNESGAFRRTGRGNGVINLQGERELAEQGNTLAHEIGHHLGLQHTWDEKYFDFRRDATIGDMIGLRYAPIIQLEPERRLNGLQTYELMSYERPAWLSVRNYCKALHTIPGHPTCSPGWDQ